MTDPLRERLDKLIPYVNEQRRLYHEENGEGMEISSGALDSLKHEIARIEEKRPDLIRPDSPTQTIGSPEDKPYQRCGIGFTKEPK